MAAIPALSKTYTTRRNVPFPAEATQSDIRRSSIWLLKQFMIDGVATGTLSGTRHANSVWAVDYSCNGTTAGTAGDGVDRWATYANVVQANSGTAHSWIVLVKSGLYCLIDANNATNNVRISFSKVAFTGGSTTAGPTSTEAWLAGVTTADGTSANALLVSDDVVSGTHYAHFTTTDDQRFHFEISRPGTGIFSALVALTPSVGGAVTDTRNWFATCQATFTARGSGGYANMNAAGQFCARTPNNSAPNAQSGPSAAAFGGAAWPAGYGVDSLTSDFPAFAIYVASLGTQVAYRGQIPDWYWCGTATVGSSIPSAAAQERTVVGDLILPFVGGAPNL
jgi:hypothetical protein